ncbi:carboxylesterase 2/para-nitrobenzyl esterase [Pseudonocardia hierapolitana]|uniref:Carboxylic ester hydrolase n=1 Tax=Pseudonocardia hierapolitana TaxID=1128676 RepID=A0A561T570_9PSEU|nr:carboxylesterase 2/para-nitrobenzyl esterase [Pseudonocardia hierapolitana]
MKTRSGEVRGTVVDAVAVFKGIPFAAPPFGNHRLRPPQPVEPWSGVRDATAFGAAPPALPLPPEVAALIPDAGVVPGEDCLNLNIWTPKVGAVALPVMVWITGGFFEFGFGASYDGRRFARDGVVCVTFNYRAGAEGFLDLGDGLANVGLLDQVAALEWVRDNIATFGGDPGNVTVFGESAGAMSIATLLAMPRAQGLFRRAILQSGAANAVTPTAAAQRIARGLAARLGVPPTRDAIAAVPVERLLQAQEELKVDLEADRGRWGPEVAAGGLPWQPSVDGDVVPDRPIDRITAGAGAGIDLIVGTNVDEGRVSLVATGMADRIPVEAVTATAATFGLPADIAVAAYRAVHPDGGNGDLLAALQTDGFWRVPALRLADAHADAPAATYMYEFAWRSPAFGGLLGACHGLEIAFVFDTLDPSFRPMLGPALGDHPPQQLADAMHAAWVGFATSGDPGWPRYDLPRRATMRFDTTSEVVDDPRAAERELWDGVL